MVLGLICGFFSKLNIKSPNKSENISICPKFGKMFLEGNLFMKYSFIKVSYLISNELTFKNISVMISIEKDT